jgi:hypothetical protein
VEVAERKFPFWAAFEARDDLHQFGVDALLLFALQLKFGIEDILLVASSSLTEGGDDKKADLVYIDSETGHAVIAQAYIAESLLGKNGKPKKAPANKASDLNTAVPWLLICPIEDLPENLKSHAQELRQALSEGAIKDIYIWYVHNLPESTNVRAELKTVEHTTASIIKQNFPQCTKIRIQALEVGTTTLDEWYSAISTPILVNNDFDIPISGGFIITNGDWRSYVTAIPATWLYALFRKYGTDIFSADVREYLGSRETDDNINNGIKSTAQGNPGHFWVYNNGITVLVNKFEERKKKAEIHINGFAIVNGAQTTGAIGSLDKPPESSAMVQVRFITCANEETLRYIVKYNNTQNKMIGPDSRSNDSIQRRLLVEFEKIPGVSYLPRRGGYEDVIRRTPDGLPAFVAGQALAAFHGDPDVAYHQKTRMWDVDSLYHRYFNEQTSAKHILFALSLLKAVERKKTFLWSKSIDNNLIGKEKDQFVFFRKRGSVFMMTSAIATCLEDILQKLIPNPFDLNFKGNISLEDAVSKWNPIVNAASAFPEPLVEGLADGFKAQETVNGAIKKFQGLIFATKDANAAIYAEFVKQVV